MSKEIIPSNQRPPSMSQLDWLWATYRNYNVTDLLPSEASSSLILTDNAVRQLIKSASGGAVTKLLLLDNQYDSTLFNLIGYASDGTAITSVQLPKTDSVTSLEVRRVREEDGDCGYAVGTKVLVVNTLTVGDTDGQGEISRTEKAYMVSMDDFVSAEVSSDEGNLIKTGSDGGLYAAVEWMEV